MHEFGVCEELVKAVEREAGGRPVTAVRARIGTTHHLDGEAVRTGFAVAAQGTVAEQAVLDLVVEHGVATCAACQAETTAPELFPLCPSCGNPDLVAGEQVTLDAVHVTGDGSAGDQAAADQAVADQAAATVPDERGA